MQCDKCKKRAVYNLQSGLFLWKVDKFERYSQNPVEIYADGEINYHLCEQHYEKCEERI